MRRVTAGLVVLVLLLAGVTYRLDLGRRWFGFDYPSPVEQPAKVAPPAGLELPSARAADAVARPSPAVAADPDAVAAALSRLERDRDLGRHVAVDVAQVSDGTVLHRYGATSVVPASTLKLLTATAALQSLGPDHRFSTTVVGTPSSSRITLVGGGDPFLARSPSDARGYPARADLDTLARSTVRALRAIGRDRVRLAYDTSLFSGPAVNPAWEPSYVPEGVVSPISPLWVDEGRERSGLVARSTDPAAAAARVFAEALERHGVTVVGRPGARTAEPDAQELASVDGAPLAQVAAHVLEVSDNEGAEVLARQVALAEHEPGSFEGGVTAVRRVLTGLGVDLSRARIHDGSGLSRDDRLPPEALLDVVTTAADADHPHLRAAVADLPVAGFTGSLAARFRTGDPLGHGMVRAKTGTLSGVHGLAGTVTTKDGAVLAFVLVADRVALPHTLDARAGLDAMASALAGCACAATP